MGIERVEPNNQSTINQSLIVVVVLFLYGKIFVPERNRLGSSAANATLCLKSLYNINCLCNVDGSIVPVVDVE